MLAGTPAIIKKTEKAWYMRDGEYYHNLVHQCEELKREMKI